MALKGTAEGLLVVVPDGHSDEIDLETVSLQEAQGGLETQRFYVLPDSKAHRYPEAGRDVVVPDPTALFDPRDVESGIEEVGMNKLENHGNLAGDAGDLGAAENSDPLQLFEDLLLLKA